MSIGERYVLAPFYSFYFHFLYYFLPISYQYRQEADEGVGVLVDVMDGGSGCEQMQ